jgi:hypothetical protein
MMNSEECGKELRGLSKGRIPYEDYSQVSQCIGGIWIYVVFEMTSERNVCHQNWVSTNTYYRLFKVETLRYGDNVPAEEYSFK